tara:strand:- start:6325 stop:7086 length:762 start_codon:yes stop_codon:yes gene_type:complete
MLVSIIIPYYKKKEYINKTVDSILSQTYKQFEIIIINDELTGESFDLLYKLKKKDNRIKIFNNQKNLGAGFSRNKGINLSKGKYVAFIDSDDLWHKDKLKLQIKFMLEKSYNFTHTSYYIIKDNINHEIIRKSEDLDFKNLLNSCNIGLSTVIASKKLFTKDIFFSNFKTKEDYYLWLKICQQGEKCYYYHEPLTYWRSTHNSLSSSTFQKIKDSFKLYYYFEKSFFKSIYRIIILALNFIKKKINDIRFIKN